MITYQRGNIVQTGCTIIVHGCNAQGKMASGVAKAMRARFPEIYPPYLKAYEEGYIKLGTNIYVLVEDKIIVNAITQEFYGRDGKQYVSYDAIRSCMIDLAYMNTFKHSIAMPTIGAGLGGGDWKIISQIIDEVLFDHDVQVYTLDNHAVIG